MEACDEVGGAYLAQLRDLRARPPVGPRTAFRHLHRSFPRDLTWIVLGQNARLLEDKRRPARGDPRGDRAPRPEAARRRMIEHVTRAGELVTRRFEER
jgi:hypothetical protein